MNTITLHFFEHSMAAYYFISIGIIIFILFLKERKVFFENATLYNFCVILFIVIFLFHRSTTFYVLLILFSIIFILKTRNVLLGAFLIIFIISGIFISSTIYFKLTVMMNGSIILLTNV